MQHNLKTFPHDDMMRDDYQKWKLEFEAELVDMLNNCILDCNYPSKHILECKYPKSAIGLLMEILGSKHERY